MAAASPPPADAPATAIEAAGRSCSARSQLAVAARRTKLIAPIVQEQEHPAGVRPRGGQPVGGYPARGHVRHHHVVRQRMKVSITSCMAWLGISASPDKS